MEFHAGLKNMKKTLMCTARRVLANALAGKAAKVLGRQLDYKSKQIPYATISFLLFSLNLKWKMLVAMVSINFSWISHHFDVYSNVPNKRALNFDRT